MSVMRVERRQTGSLVSRPQSGAWQRFDVQLAFYAAALAIIGLMVAYTNSSGAPLASGSTFTRALMWFAIGILGFSVAAAFDYRWIKTFAWLLYPFTLGMLVLTLVIGVTINGAQRWLSIGGLQFQFSELAKVLMIVVLAAFLTARKDKLGNLTTLVGAAALTIPPFFLVLIQPDLGTSLVFPAIMIGMLFMSGASLRWMAIGLATVLGALPIIWARLEDYQRRRVLSFLDPTSDTTGAGWQALQSQIAVGSGGIFGKGWTNGTQAGSSFLPVQSTDFAFAVLLEELGFVGGMVVLLLFIGLIWRVLLIGWRSESVFGVAFAAGVASMIVFQILVNAGMVAGMMPVTGIPLPFITHGG
ncbi:MAG: FtsW/RodA/SpoVE family cell cycle protein, partial [Chloroflexota bacterium]